jgi:type VI secretion system protein ImpC
MIELDVLAQRKTAIVPDGPRRYLVLGDFGGRQMGPTPVDRDNLDDVLAISEVDLHGVRMRELEDFHPDRLYQRLDVFRGLRESAPEEPAAPPEVPRANLQEMLSSASLLEQIAEGGDPFRRYIEELAHSGAAPQQQANPSREASRSDRMRAVLHDARFREVEAAWRGLDMAVRQADDQEARIHIAQLSRQEMAEDLGQSTDLRSTRMFSLLHGREWRGVFGLYSFDGDAASIELLGRLALLAAYAHAPFIAEGSPDMGPHWEELRLIPETGSIGLALPRVLLRLPYGPGTNTVESFPFEDSAHLWGNPALACLSILSNGGEEISGLPMPCAEVALTESQVHALLDNGLIPLVSFQDSDRLRLAGLRAVNGQLLPLG